MAKRPNIVIFLADDHGAWALGSAGNHDVMTPNLDALAQQGTRFENFFCVSPVCSPARASLLTGRIPSAHGVLDWIRKGCIDDPEGAFRGKDRAIGYLDGYDGFTDYLAEAGYCCAFSGKWHLGDSARPQKGYEYWQAYAFGGGQYYNYEWLDAGKIVRKTRYVTDEITEQALTFLRERPAEDERPFLLSVHYTAPHSPWEEHQHPAELWERYGDCSFAATPDLPRHPWQSPTAPYGFTPETRETNLRGYYSAITAMDAGIGRVLEELALQGLLEDSLVIFTSDNGMNMGHHGVWGKGNGTFPLNMYDTSVKVPFIASWPGQVPAGRLLQGLYSHYDVFPTLLELATVDNPLAEELPGRSFADALISGEDRLDGDVVVYDEYGPVRMIRNHAWKYVHRIPYGPHELYDLQNDPGETRNLVDRPEQQERVADMAAALRRWFSNYVDPAHDGAYEGVTGFGQIARCGLNKDDDEAWHSQSLF
jgi:choline-sulfatase